MQKPFLDRSHAGRVLASMLAPYAGRPNVLVLALPRGGVPVAYEIARALHAPLDVFLVRKLGLPGHEEFAIGAIASGGVQVLNQEAVDTLGIPDSVIEAVAARERRELARRERLYRDNRPPPRLENKTIILVDDGLATGSSMHAAVKALRQQHAGQIIVAVPVAAPDTCEQFRQPKERVPAARSDKPDDIICAATPEPFQAVGLWYEDFSQTTDEEVRELLARASEQPAAA